MRLARVWLVGGMIAALGGATARGQNDPGAKVKDVAGAKPVIELVFVIDTTGSMGGLIEGAKQKVWGIVNDVMASPTKPEVRLGLVAYRDRGDAYVTQVLPVTRDLDKVYNTLMGYQAQGGGDGPEDVRRALADGVNKAGWSRRSPNVAQILFLVGDAPPHDDYQDEPSTIDSAKKAVAAGILVNAIQCGNMAGTAEAWKAISRAGEGQYFAIAQDGGVVAVATPFDEELARLGSQVGSTYMAFGGGMAGMSAPAFRESKLAAQKATEGRVMMSAPAAAQADRSYNKAINAVAYDEHDLIQGVENGTVKLDALKVEELPDELQKLTPEKRQAVIAEKIAARKALRTQILELSKKREGFLAEARKAQEKKGQAGFDTAVSEALRSQIRSKLGTP